MIQQSIVRDWPAPLPEALVFVVGDIHGNAARLESLLEQIDSDIATTAPQDWRVVFVGDYIDRGEHSDEILKFVHGAAAANPDRLVFLAGNHERMLLDFLEDPAGEPRRWLRHGGLQTLASYGIRLKSDRGNSSGDLLDAAGDLRDAMGTELIGWLEGLPSSWQSGNLWVVHAGADPAVPMPEQRADVLMWGCDRFLEAPRADGQWVAFGHIPFDRGFAVEGRIGVDTGAAYGGPLSAARIDPIGSVTFLTG